MFFFFGVGGRLVSVVCYSIHALGLFSFTLAHGVASYKTFYAVTSLSADLSRNTEPRVQFKIARSSHVLKTQLSEDDVKIICGALFCNLSVFFVCGGRLSSLLPSHLLSLGAFARTGMPCSVRSASKVGKYILCS